MNVLIFGATGATGQQIVRQALSRGHRVSAFVRRPEALGNDQVQIVIGDILRDKSRIGAALHGQDLVISALGRGKSLRPDHLISRSMEAIVPQMQQAGVRRMILMSAFGVGESLRDAPLFPAMMFRTLLRGIFADKKSAEEKLRASSLDWTIVHPVLLTNGPVTGRYRAGERLKLHGVPRISRADVAHFILTEAQAGAFVRKAVVVSY